MLTPLFLALYAATPSSPVSSDPEPAAPTDTSTPVAALEDFIPAPEGERREAPAIRPFQAEDGRWSLELAPYFWAAGLKAKTDAGTLKLSFSDVWDDLDFAYMGAVTGEKSGSPWGFMVDSLYFDLEDKPIELQATVLIAAASYRIREDQPHKLLFGARYWDLDISAGPFGGGVNWVDAIVGVSTSHAFNEKFSANVLADVGGFGIGQSADITYQGIGTLNYRLSDRFTLGAGYRYLYVDQESKTKFDTDVYGPIVGLRIAL